MKCQVFAVCDLLNYFGRFLSKLIHFILLFAERHLQRLETMPDSPFPRLLELLADFTLKQPSYDALSECCLIWTSIIEYIEQQYATRKTDPRLAQYSPLFVEFSKRLFYSM